jgi:type I restriction enzyme S subunit
MKFATTLANDKVSAEDTSLPYLGLEHIESWTGQRLPGEIGSSEGLASLFSQGDVLFGKLRPYLAKVHLAEEAGIVSSEALVIRCDHYILPAFLKYYMLSPSFINIVDSSTYGSKMPRASWDFIGNLPMLLPEEDEQAAIVAYLDFKTAQIDALIAKQRTLLGKLTESRIAIINNAITRGVNKEVICKKCATRWPSEIPSHWTLIPLKYGCEFLNSRRIPLSAEIRAQMSDRVFPYYGASGIIDYVENYIFDEQTILIAEDGANLLSRSTPLAFTAGGRYWVNNHAHILKPYLGPFEYWAYLLCAVDYTLWITGSAQPKLSKENLGRILLPVPPESEQRAILAFIQASVKPLDDACEVISNAIIRLIEYRSAVITNAVTGRIDIRNVPIPLTGDLPAPELEA